jgi:fibrillarin-like pre-rRNA processing protein
MTRLLVEQGEGRVRLLTQNMVPGLKVYNEELVQKDGKEFRRWDPFRSKLAAAIIKGLSSDLISEGMRVLYLGTSTGTTPSHVSDLVGERGLLVGVEFAPRVAREFLENVARRRKNVIPFVADARDPSRYAVSKVDVVYCDIAQQDQTEIALSNCESLLKPGGALLLIVKSRSIDVLKEPRLVFEEEAKKLERGGFRVESVIDLRPYDKDHAIIYALKGARAE